MAPRIIVHGHFYQPPRDNPWTGEIDKQPSAAPAHDWNERVHEECYRPNAFARIPTPGGDDEQVVNNFERLSFNVGPTLLSWMEAADPETYARILEADRLSSERVGHGNAIAQAFHHTILPLSPIRDVRTQVRWGLADFRYRFGREGEGMWLPETAANDDVLSVLIEEGLSFTILAPNQARSWQDAHGEWIDARLEPVDTRVPYRYMHRDGSGRSLSLFFYDGEISRRIAFERLGSSAERFLDEFEYRWTSEGQVIHAATDGETYGHHHTFTDLGLAYALFVEAEKRDFEVTNYATHLEQYPPTRAARIWGGEGTSWSCAHGVGRWARDCGCHTGGEEGWNQKWRVPLRAALDIVRRVADEAFERMGSSLFIDPWVARDAYVEVVIGMTPIEDFLARVSARPVGHEEAHKMHDLLDLQVNAMSMYTSCGWFFSDISGIETVQILRYAARTIELLEGLGQPTSESAFIAALEQAESNKPDEGTGAGIYLGITPANV